MQNHETNFYLESLWRKLANCTKIACSLSVYLSRRHESSLWPHARSFNKGKLDEPSRLVPVSPWRIVLKGGNIRHRGRKTIATVHIHKPGCETRARTFRAWLSWLSSLAGTRARMFQFREYRLTVGVIIVYRYFFREAVDSIAPRIKEAVHESSAGRARDILPLLRT